MQGPSPHLTHLCVTQRCPSLLPPLPLPHSSSPHLCASSFHYSPLLSSSLTLPSCPSAALLSLSPTLPFLPSPALLSSALLTPTLWLICPMPLPLIPLTPSHHPLTTPSPYLPSLNPISSNSSCSSFPHIHHPSLLPSWPPTPLPFHPPLTPSLFLPSHLMPLYPWEPHSDSWHEGR